MRRTTFLATGAALLLTISTAPVAQAVFLGGAAANIRFDWHDDSCSRHVSSTVDWAASGTGWVGLAVRGFNYVGTGSVPINANFGPFFVDITHPLVRSDRAYNDCFPTSGDESHGRMYVDAYVIDCGVGSCSWPSQDPAFVSSVASDFDTCHWGHTSGCS